MQAVENGQNHGRINEMQILQQLAVKQPVKKEAMNGVLEHDRPRGG